MSASSIYLNLEEWFITQNDPFNQVFTMITKLNNFTENSGPKLFQKL